MAYQGYSIDEMSREEYQAMLDATGYSDVDARAIWSKATPEANADISVSDGMMIVSYFDPSIGKPVVRATPVPGYLKSTPESKWNTKDIGGISYWYDENEVKLPGQPPTLIPIGYTEGPEEDEILTVSEAETLGVPFGTTVREAKDMGLTPGDKKTATLTTEEVMKTDQAKRLQGLVDLQDAIENYKNIIKEVGAASGWTKSDRQRLDSSREFINLAIKNAEGLGALQAPDIELITRQIPDITVEGFLNSLVPRPFAASRALDTLKDVSIGYSQKAKNQYDQLIAAGADPNDPFVKNLSDKLGITSQGGFTDEEREYIRQNGGNPDDPSFTNDLGTSQNGPVGMLSEKYESGGDPGAIGYDSTGGYSYGAYQLAHKNALAFAEKSPYADKFKGLAFNSNEWRDRWKQVAQEDPEGFKEAQRKYIEETHYLPQVEYLASKGIDLSKYSPVLRDVVWSTAVQHGPRTDVIAKAFEKAGKDADEASVIRAIYDERWGGGKRFASSTEGVKKSVYNRFFGKGGELETALSMIG